MIVGILGSVNCRPRLSSSRSVELYVRVGRFCFFVPSRRRRYCIGVILPRFANVGRNGRVLTLTAYGVVAESVGLLGMCIRGGRRDIDTSYRFVCASRSSLGRGVIYDVRIVDVIGALCERGYTRLRGWRAVVGGYLCIASLAIITTMLVLTVRCD